MSSPKNAGVSATTHRGGAKHTMRQRKMLMRRTQELGPTEHEEIFKILTTHGVDHSQNNNGVFVNLTRVPDVVLDEINVFVDFCFENKHQLDEYDKRLNEYKINHNYTGLMASPPPPPPSSPQPPSLADQVSSLQVASPASVPKPASSASPLLTEYVMSVAKRIMNSKFHQAKKRYAKRRLVEKDTLTFGGGGGGDHDGKNEPLTPDAYLL